MTEIQPDTGHLPGCAFGRTNHCTCTYLKQWVDRDYVAPTFRAEARLAGPGTLVIPDEMMADFDPAALKDVKLMPEVISDSEHKRRGRHARTHTLQPNPTGVTFRAVSGQDFLAGHGSATSTEEIPCHCLGDEAWADNLKEQNKTLASRVKLWKTATWYANGAAGLLLVITALRESGAF